VESFSRRETSRFSTRPSAHYFLFLFLFEGVFSGKTLHPPAIGSGEKEPVGTVDFSSVVSCFQLHSSFFLTSVFLPCPTATFRESATWNSIARAAASPSDWTYVILATRFGPTPLFGFSLVKMHSGSLHAPRRKGEDFLSYNEYLSVSRFLAFQFFPVCLLPINLRNREWKGPPLFPVSHRYVCSAPFL